MEKLSSGALTAALCLLYIPSLGLGPSSFALRPSLFALYPLPSLARRRPGSYGALAPALVLARRYQQLKMSDRVISVFSSTTTTNYT